MTDVSNAFEAASDQFGRIVTSVDGRSRANATICQVTVQELAEHVLAGNEFAVRLLAGASAASAREGIDQLRLDAEPAGQIALSCAAQTRAFAHADRGRLLRHPSGDIDFDTFVRLRLGELVVHGWDIAVAAGLDTTLDAGTVADLWSRVEPHLDEMRRMGVYGAGAAGRLPLDASRQDRLLEAFGRGRSDHSPG